MLSATASPSARLAPSMLSNAGTPRFRRSATLGLSGPIVCTRRGTPAASAAVGKRLGDLDLPAGQARYVEAVPAEVAGDEDLVDLPGRQQRRGGPGVRPEVLLPAAGQVDGVADCRQWREPLSQTGGQRVAEPRHLQAAPGQGVGSQGPLPPAVTDDANPQATWSRPGAQERGGLDQLTRRVHPEGAGGGAGRVHRGERGRDRAGVGSRGALAGRTGSHGHQQHGLAGLGQHTDGGEETVAVGERLDVHGHDRGVSVVGQVREHLRRGDVHLAADRHEPRDPHARTGGEAGDLGAQLTALRHDGQAAGREVAPRQLQLRPGVVQAQAAGADDPRAGGPDPGAELGLRGHPGRDRQDPPGAEVEGLVDHAGELRGRHADHDQLRSWIRTRPAGARWDGPAPAGSDG